MAESPPNTDTVINAQFKVIKEGSPSPNATYINYLGPKVEVSTNLHPNEDKQQIPSQTVQFRKDRRPGILGWIKKALGLQKVPEPKQPAIDWYATVRDNAIKLDRVIKERDRRDGKEDGRI